ncbi:arylsulfatase A-like enzyme [Lewinella aquimaris]|uniref:Arylsulfatase A-like enzyme n=1 Tax=Neolewinella aquimaris TaxID=1835722 RepID=A0A840EHZ3_9BACT|nr:sulfatase-like hydrolase/transferase [Neolewinella aquimaris]MBB4080516.1 arylsulfatase A-like enzyme [Neolewinella aquimaris]
MYRFLSLLCLLALLSCANRPAPASPPTAAQPNILLIVVDDQGYADFTPFADPQADVQTPNISRLGRQGTVYTQAYVTAPVCSPSRAGLLTGKNQFRWDGPASWGPGLPDSVKTLAEYLREAGYATAKIGKNDLGQKFHRNDVREYPLHHGFDEFLGFSAHAHDYWLLSQDIYDRTPDPQNTSALLGPLMHNMGTKSYEEGYITDILTDEAVEYVRAEREQPYFLMLSYNAVHHLIHEVPQRYLDKYDVEPIANYDPEAGVAFENRETGSYSAYYDKYSRLGAIQDDDMRKYYLANLNNLDDNIGRVLDAIDEETIIVFLSDNGGSPLTGANNSPLTGGKYSLWEGGIRVPLAIRWPGAMAAGSTEERYVSALDILPTLAAAAGVTVNDPAIDGIDLREPDADRVLVWKWQENWAIRRGDYKLTNARENHWKSRPYRAYIAPIRDDNSLKLFNVADDPGERNDLVNERPELVEELRAAYEAWEARNLGVY